MSKTKIDISQRERVLLTDTLPFELPLFFTNAGLAALAHKVRIGTHANLHFHTKLLLSSNKNRKATKPLSFAIRKNATSNRRIALPHPRAQHAFVDFYAEYDQFIAHACSISDYSLRHPSRVGSFFYDKRFAEDDHDPDPTHPDADPAGFHNQRRWASNYFNYRVNQSYKFFESEEFLSLEQRFNLLRKLDITRCFESIYTHSIVWAGRGKEFAKQYKGHKSKDFFEGKFDTLIQNTNWGETHGIVIGPEFSRIFSEVILQRIDASIRTRLGKLAREVVVRRYVDDYYLFANDVSTLDSTESHIAGALREFNLFLNDSKSETIVRPFLSAISVSRSRTGEVIENLFNAAEEIFARTSPTATPARIDLLCANAINAIRRTATELNVSYAQLSTFGLSVLSRQVQRSRLIKPPAPNEVVVQPPLLLAFLIGVLRLAQFLYNTDRRVNTSIKLGRVFRHVAQVAKSRKCSTGPLKSQMLDLVRSSAPTKADLDVEVVSRINLMIAADCSIRASPNLTPEDLAAVIGKPDMTEMNYFELIGALFICRRRSKFNDYRKKIITQVKQRLTSIRPRSVDDAEWTLTLTDFLACPYVDEQDKCDVVMATHESICGSPCSPATAQAIAKASHEISFVDWSGSADLSRLLARKELTAAYD